MSLPRPALMINTCLQSVFKLKSSRFLVKNYSNCVKMDENSIIALTKQLAPPLTNDKHKGQAGRIGVFGGSLEYTGAPYFAAIASLKVGADLSHVFCAREAAPVIKSYSPELIVHPLLDAPGAAAQIEPWLDRLHVVLIGPGLGREASTFKVIDEVVEMCKVRKKPLVIDADGLYYVSINPDVLREYPSPVILTPNVMEFTRLIGSNGEGNKKEQSGNFLALAKNITILCKGHDDEIFNREALVRVAGGGSGRRCGGQGDLLSGAVSTFLAWALEQLKPCDNRPLIAAFAACKLARACNARAFAKYGRSMTCSDMIHEIHPVFDELFERR
nr:PREDICTED: ATP-dependent (S)-NAD(P)H-hydrate dehydratase [Tribolium castaneum]|eukprot:XP_974937.2 PREDICTED: ATP-dependent (S)-NAD(P)H-hydrate dehydratase [Tribolium castaneum]